MIPARGGSKTLPRKNLCLIDGVPLIRRAVETCLAVSSVERVVVTTDDPEIAAAAGPDAVILDRAAELATDTALTWPVVRHVMQECPAEYVALVQCTSPLLSSQDVEACLDAVASHHHIAVACHPFHGVVLDGRGEFVNWTRDDMVPVKRRQSLSRQWLVSGSCWAFSGWYALNMSQYGGRLVPVRSSHPVRCEIDDEGDLMLARALVSCSIL